MNSPVRVSQRTKTIECHNPISGHRWAEYEPVPIWDVDGPFGHICQCRSEATAEEKAAEWRAFYNKYPMHP